MPRRLLACALAAAALGLAACGGGGAGKEKAKAATPPPPASTADRDLSHKPKVTVPPGAAPSRLVKRDIVVGDGAVAKPGDQVAVQYVGVLQQNGKQFDSSWDSGQPFEFQLGAGGVIPGWDQGVAGMRVGGRRELIIPAALAYGESGYGPIPPNAPLVFVVDLLRIR